MAEPAGQSRRMAAFGATLSPERVLAKDRNPPVAVSRWPCQESLLRGMSRHRGSLRATTATGRMRRFGGGSGDVSYWHNPERALPTSMVRCQYQSGPGNPSSRRGNR